MWHKFTFQARRLKGEHGNGNGVIHERILGIWFLNFVATCLQRWEN